MSCPVTTTVTVTVSSTMNNTIQTSATNVNSIQTSVVTSSSSITTNVCPSITTVPRTNSTLMKMVETVSSESLSGQKTAPHAATSIIATTQPVPSASSSGQQMVTTSVTTATQTVSPTSSQTISQASSSGQQTSATATTNVTATTQTVSSASLSGQQIEPNAVTSIIATTQAVPSASSCGQQMVTTSVTTVTQTVSPTSSQTISPASSSGQQTFSTTATNVTATTQMVSSATSSWQHTGSNTATSATATTQTISSSSSSRQQTVSNPATNVTAITTTVSLASSSRQQTVSNPLTNVTATTQTTMSSRIDVTPEETNFLRFTSLVLKIGPRAVRHLFDMLNDPNHLDKIITDNKQKLENLLNDKIINKDHWTVLFPANKHASSKNFDITLMIAFLREVTCIKAPKSGWNRPPHKYDYSGEADVARVKYYRNKVAHAVSCSINTRDFNIMWNDLREAIIRLSGERFKTETSAMLCAALDSSYQDLYREFKAMKEDIIPSNIKFLMDVKVEGMATEDKTFVSTRSTKSVKDAVDRYGVVMVTGPPGSGKTATVNHIALQLQEEGYTICPVVSTKEIIEYWMPEIPQVFVYNDPFGIHDINQSELHQWTNQQERISTCFQYSNMKILATIKSHIIKDEQISEDVISSSNLKIVSLVNDDIVITDDEQQTAPNTATSIIATAQPVPSASSSGQQMVTTSVRTATQTVSPTSSHTFSQASSSRQQTLATATTNVTETTQTVLSATSSWQQTGSNTATNITAATPTVSPISSTGQQTVSNSASNVTTKTQTVSPASSSGQQTFSIAATNVTATTQTLSSATLSWQQTGSNTATSATATTQTLSSASISGQQIVLNPATNITATTQPVSLASSSGQQTVSNPATNVTATTQTTMSSRIDVTPEETNFLRFTSLVLKIGPRAVRHLFDMLNDPNHLDKIITDNRQKLENLLNNKIINKDHWTVLFPANKHASSKHFDITLMIAFLREVTCMKAPKSGWNRPPDKYDYSGGADIARVKYYRNQVAHAVSCSINTRDFNIMWNYLSEAIIRLGGEGFKTETSAMLCAALDSSYQDLYRNLKAMKEDIIPSKFLMDVKVKGMATEDKTFVSTRSTKSVQDAVDRYGVVMVTGPPGSGKTATVNHIALQLQEEGYTICPVVSTKEIIEYWMPEIPQVFVYNDPFGIHDINQSELHQWRNQQERLSTCFQYSNMKILATIRSRIIKDEQISEDVISSSNLKTVSLVDDDIVITDDEQQTAPNTATSILATPQAVPSASSSAQQMVTTSVTTATQTVSPTSSQTLSQASSSRQQTLATATTNVTETTQTVLSATSSWQQTGSNTATNVTATTQTLSSASTSGQQILLNPATNVTTQTQTESSATSSGQQTVSNSATNVTATTQTTLYSRIDGTPEETNFVQQTVGTIATNITATTQLVSLASSSGQQIVSNPATNVTATTQTTMSSRIDVTPEETNFLRFTFLVLKIVPRAVRHLFDMLNDPNHLDKIIADNIEKLENLLNDKIINKDHWTVLFPANKHASSKHFDITLMIAFLRKVTCMKAPKSGWNRPPDKYDYSVEADVERVRYYRNKVAHAVSCSIDTRDFKIIWNDLSEAIIRLGGEGFKTETSAMPCLASSYQDLYRELKAMKVKEDIIPSNIKFLMNVKVEGMATEDKTFVSTRATKSVKDAVDQYGVIMVTGPPGSGKTATVNHIALQLQEEGYTICPVVSTKEIIEYWMPEIPQVFVYNDPFGIHDINQSELHQWRNQQERLSTCFQYSNMKILATIRSHIIKDEQISGDVILSSNLKTVSLVNDDIVMTEMND